MHIRMWVNSITLEKDQGSKLHVERGNFSTASNSKRARLASMLLEIFGTEIQLLSADYISIACAIILLHSVQLMGFGFPCKISGLSVVHCGLTTMLNLNFSAPKRCSKMSGLSYWSSPILLLLGLTAWYWRLFTASICAFSKLIIWCIFCI